MNIQTHGRTHTYRWTNGRTHRHMGRWTDTETNRWAVRRTQTNGWRDGRTDTDRHMGRWTDTLECADGRTHRQMGRWTDTLRLLFYHPFRRFHIDGVSRSDQTEAPSKRPKPGTIYHGGSWRVSCFEDLAPLRPLAQRLITVPLYIHTYRSCHTSALLWRRGGRRK